MGYSIIHRSSFIIRHSSFIIHHSSSIIIRHSSFVIQHSEINEEGIKNLWKMNQKSTKNRSQNQAKSVSEAPRRGLSNNKPGTCTGDSIFFLCIVESWQANSFCKDASQYITTLRRAKTKPVLIFSRYHLDLRNHSFPATKAMCLRWGRECLHLHLLVRGYQSHNNHANLRPFSDECLCPTGDYNAHTL